MISNLVMLKFHPNSNGDYVLIIETDDKNPALTFDVRKDAMNDIINRVAQNLPVHFQTDMVVHTK